MNTFSKLVVIDGLVYQEIRDYNGKLLFCRRFIADQHPPEHREGRREGNEEKKGFPNADWKKLSAKIKQLESVALNLKVKEKPLPLRPFFEEPPPVKAVPKEVDFSEDDEYYFSYLRPGATVEFIYGKMSKFINTLTDEFALGKSDSKGFGADYGLSQEIKDKLRWKEFKLDNRCGGVSVLAGGSNPLYEDRPLTWEEIDNMEGIGA